MTLLAILWLLPGCSRENPLGTVRVRGKVTYKAQPVAGATVTFVGEGDTKTATAITASDGRYELATLHFAGAMPGQYAVLVEKLETPPEKAQTGSMEEAAQNANRPLPRAKRLLPSRYSDAAKTPLHVEVKAGQANDFDLELSDRG